MLMCAIENNFSEITSEHESILHLSYNIILERLSVDNNVANNFKF